MDLVLDNLGTLLRGLWLTVQLSLLGFGGAFVVGLVLAACRVGPVGPLRRAATVFTEAMRNIPLVVLLFLVYFGLPKVELLFSPFQSALIGMSLYSGAYMAETIRSGINSVAAGQAEAARSIGLTFFQVLGIVVLPQALRTVVQPIGNLFSAHVKNTAIAATIGTFELTYVANQIGEAQAEAITLLVAAGIGYVILLLPSGWVFSVLERRLAIRR